MKNVIKIANQIISRTLTNLPSIRTDFNDVKRKINKLENEIVAFRGDDTSWDAIENWKPLAEEIIKSIEDIMEKL